MGPKKNNIKENEYSILEEQVKKVMELTAATNNSIENLKATVEETNNELRKTNENLTQLWETANKVLTKATNIEQSIIHTKSNFKRPMKNLRNYVLQQKKRH